jgi:hypothetical protein
MKIKFDMISDPALQAKLESLDFDPEVAEQYALELLELVGGGTDLGSVWTNFHYDEKDGNRIVGYDVTRLPAHGSKPGQA